MIELVAVIFLLVGVGAAGEQQYQDGVRDGIKYTLKECQKDMRACDKQ